MKVLYARADKVPEDCDYITEGKCYAVVNDSRLGFSAIDDTHGVINRRWGVDGAGIHWARLEYPYRDPDAVEALIEAAGKLAEAYVALCEMVGANYHQSQLSVYKSAVDALARLSPADGEIKA